MTGQYRGAFRLNGSRPARPHHAKWTPASRMKQWLRLLLLRVAQKLTDRLGFDMVWRHYYSPIPDLAEIGDDFWDARSDLVGLRFGDVDRQLDYVATELASFISEFRPPAGFHIDNGGYGPGDAEILYGIVRAYKPERILELGVGFSTLVTAAACHQNEREGHPVRFVAVDPYPSDLVKTHPAGLSELRAERATDLPPETFSELRAGDILFIDTTHTVKLGGDVTYLVLEVLPRLAPGVLVQMHDIFLPWHYPRRWFEADGYFWAEQYLLQAFLCFNSEFEILLACHLLSRERQTELSQLVPSFDGTAAPAAIWLRRLEHGQSTRR